MAARIKTGTTTWAERGLVASGWYPPPVRTAEARLHYYASQFPLVENDAGYWAVLARAQVETWARRTPDDFTMNMKAHALLTGHYTDPKHLPKDLRGSLSRDPIDQPHVYARELDPALVREVARRFRDACLRGLQSGGMGEGWGDFMSATFLNDPVVGAYVTGDAIRGIRAFSMATRRSPTAISGAAGSPRFTTSVSCGRRSCGTSASAWAPRPSSSWSCPTTTTVSPAPRRRYGMRVSASVRYDSHSPGRRYDQSRGQRMRHLGGVRRP